MCTARVVIFNNFMSTSSKDNVAEQTVNNDAPNQFSSDSPPESPPQITLQDLLVSAAMKRGAILPEVCINILDTSTQKFRARDIWMNKVNEYPA